MQMRLSSVRVKALALKARGLIANSRDSIGNDARVPIPKSLASPVREATEPTSTSGSDSMSSDELVRRSILALIYSIPP